MNSNSFGDIAGVINSKIESTIDKKILHPCPARIIEYDFKKRIAKIQCLIKVSNKNGDFIENPVISNIPVVCYSTKNALASIPIKENDEGLVIFTNIGIENWLINGGIQDEHMHTKQSMQNAFFIPGIFNKTITSKAKNNNDIFINLDDSWIEISKKNIAFTIGQNTSIEMQDNGKGKIVFGNNDILKNISDQLGAIKDSLTQLSNSLTTISSLTVVTASPGTPSPVSPDVTISLTSSKTQIDTNISNISALKSTLDSSLL